MEIALEPLAAAVALALIYATGAGVADREASERFWARRRWISAAAGVSLAYVFVDVLPELAAQNRALREASGTEELAFAEQRIYVLALLSFVVIYGLEHIVIGSREARRELVERGGRDAVYWLHVGGFAAYSALIGYLLVERAERGLASFVLYAVAMAIHFVIVNHSLDEAHGAAYRRGGRWWLAASVVAGCVVGLATTLSVPMFARLFAILAGGVVITSVRAELPGDDRRGRFWPFCMGAVGFAILLMAT
jgi:hypothetical protein